MSLEFGTGERGHFGWRDGKLVPIREAKKLVLAPAVHQDTMEPIESMATPYREVFDSKSAYRRHLEEHGFEETGGEIPYEPPKERSYEDLREDIKRARMDVKYGRVEFTEEEKEQHLREKRQWEAYKKRQRGLGY